MLKKISLTAAAFLMMTSIASAVAITGGYVDMTNLGTAATPGLFYKPSNKVVVLYGHDLASNAQNYTLAAKHTSGDRTYSTSNLSTAIYWIKDATVKDGIALTSSASFLSSNAGESLYSGWTGM
jgi:hypothetical protein